MDNIRLLFDQLQREIGVMMSMIADNEVKAEQLRDFDFSLRAFEKKLNKTAADQKIERTQLDSEKTFLKDKLIEISEKEVKVAQLTELKESIKSLSEELDKKKARLDAQEIEIDERLKQAIALDERQVELDHREELLKKEMLLDRERKVLLDQQAIDNQTEANRLQKIAESLQKKML